MAEIDHTIIEQAIETLLKADSNLFDESSTDGTKLINIDEGIPVGASPTTETLPGAFITLQSEVFKNRGTIGSNAVRSFEHEIIYKIRISIADYGNKKNEQVLNSLQKELLEVIESNNKLSDTVDSCFPQSITRAEETEKNSIFSRDILIKCIKTSN